MFSIFNLSLVASVLIFAAVLVLAVIIAFYCGITYRKGKFEKVVGSAEQQSKKILDNATKEAENKKRESLLEIKEEMHKSRSELEKEIKERRSEISRQERRLVQKEESVDKKMDSLEQKEELLKKKNKELEAMQQDVAEIQKKQLAQLEKISGLSVTEAKELLLSSIESEVKHEAAIRVKAIEDEAKEEADKRARNIIGLAIQRCAADHAAETTVSVVSLPSDELKGRIIGREGRNIRAIENATGVDLIIDDTPEAVVLSSFDPIRREVARVTLEKLISDGRIHPGRIEETVEKARKEVDNVIKQEAERATFETGVHGLHPELLKILGRLRFRTSYGQNVLMHSIEVAHLSGLMAGELGADITLAKRAGLLHDIGKAVDHEQEGTHIQIGANLAKKYHESNEIVHAIMAHHGDVEAETIIACIVQAADAISAARPGARRENLETYIKRLEKLEEIADGFEGVEKSYAIQAGREIRIMVKPEVVGDDSITMVARDIVKKIEAELEYPGQIKVNVIREVRAVDYAK